MPIAWAIEIDTETSSTDADLGLFGGQLRYVSGRRNYQNDSIMDKSGNGHDVALVGTPTINFDSLTFNGSTQRGDSAVNETSGTAINYYLDFKSGSSVASGVIYDNAEGITNGLFWYFDTTKLKIQIQNAGTVSIIEFDVAINTRYYLVVNYTTTTFSATLNDVTTAGTSIVMDATSQNGAIASAVGGGTYSDITLYSFKIEKDSNIILDIEGKNSTVRLYGHNSEIYITVNGSETFVTSYTSGQLYQFSNGIFKSGNTALDHGMVFTCLDNTDMLNGYLTTQKGSALTTGDMFEYYAPFHDSIPAARYLGTNDYIINKLIDPGNSKLKCDFEIAGKYERNSQAIFSISNEDKFEVYIESNYGIQLINKRVKLFCIIDDVAYQYYQGTIETTDTKEQNLVITCNTDNRNYKNTMPPRQINEALFPDIETASNYGKYVPICVGDMPKALAYNTTTERVSQDVSVFRILSFTTYGVTGRVYGKALDTIEDGTYLRIIAGGSEDTELVELPDQTKIYKVLSSTKDDDDVFSLILEKRFEEGTVANLNTETNTSEENNTVTETWWAQLIVLKSSFIVSNDEIYEFFLPNLDTHHKIYTWDSNASQYTELSELIESSSLTGDSEIPFPYFKTILTNMQADGNVQLYSPIFGKGFRFRDVENEIWYDRKRTTLSEKYRINTSVNVNSPVFGGYLEANIDENVDNVWFGIDFEIHIEDANIAGVLNVALEFNPGCAYEDPGLGFQFIGETNEPDDTTILQIEHPAGDSDFKVALLPEDFYKVDGNTGDGYVNYFNISRLGDERDCNCNGTEAFSTLSVYGLSENDLIPEDASVIIELGDGEDEVIYRVTSQATVTAGSAILNISPVLADSYSGAKAVVSFGSDSVSAQLKQESEITTKMKAGLYTHYKFGIAVALDGNVTIDYGTAPDWTSYVRVSQAGLFSSRTVNLKSQNLYSVVYGEAFDSNGTDNLYDALRLVAQRYGNIAGSVIDYGNIDADRSGWHVGRQILKKKLADEYIKEICEQSFIASAVGRKGGYLFKAWQDDETPVITFDSSNIKSNSISNFSQTPISKIYNDITIYYAYDQGSDDFESSYFVKNVEQDTFPLESATDVDGQLEWIQWVGGIENDYDLGKNVWELFHDSYTNNQVKNQLPTKYSELNWFIDPYLLQSALFNRDENSSSWFFLNNLANWTSQRKHKVRFSVNVDSTNILLQLLDTANFNDYNYTDSSNALGWISYINVDGKAQKIIIEMILKPGEIESDDIIVERGNKSDPLIIEHSSNVDFIDEDY